MNELTDFRGMSQFADEISSEYRASACGPVTAYTIVRYLHPVKHDLSVNHLYQKLGCTKIGLTKRRFIRNLRKLLGSDWIIEPCGIAAVKEEIKAGRPVAAKFDKWTAWRWWNHSYEFDYHWVPVIGWEEVGDELFLFIHDNGNSNRASQIRRISYSLNKPILSFVKLEKTGPI